jgi:hypothetical protein
VFNRKSETEINNDSFYPFQPWFRSHVQTLQMHGHPRLCDPCSLNVLPVKNRQSGPMTMVVRRHSHRSFGQWPKALMRSNQAPQARFGSAALTNKKNAHWRKPMRISKEQPVRGRE